MPDLTKRSYQKELLDRTDIPFDDIKRNMEELEFINRHLGGHSATLSGFKRILGNKKKISVCEIGCGGADNLNIIERWCDNNDIDVELTGIDINPNCIEYAKQNHPGYNLLCSDYRSQLPAKPGIIFASLFCHHFTDDEVLEILKWMKENSSEGFFINDLHRHTMAYYLIRILTKLFSHSYLVKNDAPVSVLRGFKKKEWKNLLHKAGIENYSIKWRWGFRYLVTAPCPPKGGT